MAGSGLDSWQDLVEKCKSLELEVQQSLGSTRGSSFNSQTEWRMRVQESLGRFSLAVLSLKQKLTASKSNLTGGELRRREAITVGLEGREKQLRLAFQQQQAGMKQSESEEEQRRKLLNSSSSIVNVGLDNDWSNREDQPLLGGASGSASDMMSQYHQRKTDRLEEQDRGLDALQEIIVRQKNLAQNIQTEVGSHNDLLDDIDNGLERTTHRITTTTENIRIVGRNDSVWRYWLTILALFIVIIIIVAVH